MTNPVGSLSPPRAKLQPTPEQQAIIDAAKGSPASIMVSAFAGCAKSTTLEMLAHAVPLQPALALAFNKKIATELEQRVPPHFSVKTLNGLGHSAIAKALGKKLTLDTGKLGKLVTSVTKEAQFKATSDQWIAIRELAEAAFSAGMIPSFFAEHYSKSLIQDEWPVWQELAEANDIISGQELWELAREVMVQSIKLSFLGTINFDDQIYFSVLFAGVYPRFPLVLIDEAQDLSPLNHMQLARCAAGRIIAVGDPKQAIYAFRGADSASMAKIRALRTDWIDLPLATTFRVPHRIVARNIAHAPGFTAWDSNHEGAFADWSYEAALNAPNAQPQLPPRMAQEAQQGRWSGWHWQDILDTATAIRPDASIFILCRNNAPLLSMAFKLIRQRVGCQMLGREIGKGLLTLSKKLFSEDTTPVAKCVELIQEWASHETALAHANKREDRIDLIIDKSECLLAVCESGTDIKMAGDLRRTLEQLFANKSGVILATGHKIKGLEADLVVHLDPWRCPGKRAIAAGGVQLEQEMNIKYVVETRTKHTLIEANLEDFSRG